MCAYYRVFIAIAVCAIGLGRGILPADAAPSTEPLRVDALVAEALKQNPEIDAAGQRWRAAQERARQARALDDPEFKIELFNYPNRLDPDASANTIFGLSQRFPFPGKLSLREGMAVKEAEMAASLLRSKEREIASQGKSAYYEVFLAHKAIEIHRSEEHTSELQSRLHLVCRLLLEKKKIANRHTGPMLDPSTRTYWMVHSSATLSNRPPRHKRPMVETPIRNGSYYVPV